jgi:peptidoglycan/LPS O-acetylase OafA/YrhL
MKDRRTLVMLALLVVLAALGALYLFTPDDRADGTTVRMIAGIGAVLALLLLVASASGGSRGKRPTRDDDGPRNG